MGGKQHGRSLCVRHRPVRARRVCTVLHVEQLLHPVHHQGNQEQIVCVPSSRSVSDGLMAVHVIGGARTTNNLEWSHLERSRETSWDDSMSVEKC